MVDPTVMTALVGGVSALVTLVVSKTLDNSNAERRIAAKERRDNDRRLRDECARLTEYAVRMQGENAGLRALLLARGIPLPPVLDERPRLRSPLLDE